MNSNEFQIQRIKSKDTLKIISLDLIQYLKNLPSI